MLLFILMAATLVAVYHFWIRPILQSRPAFRDLCQKEENFPAALRVKFAGIKQKLSSATVIAASVIVSAYDFFAPIVSGVDELDRRKSAILGVAADFDRDHGDLPVPAQPLRQAAPGRTRRRDTSPPRRLTCGLGLQA